MPQINSWIGRELEGYPIMSMHSSSTKVTHTDYISTNNYLMRTGGKRIHKKRKQRKNLLTNDTSDEFKVREMV